MKKCCEISIIIPVFNAEKFVLNSYQQILNQNLVDFELLYIDNNSTDITVSIVKTLIEKDERVHLLFEKKQGAAAARNRGIENAKGDFLYFFDVDDELYENAIYKLMTILKSNQAIDSVFGKRTKSKVELKSKDSNRMNIIINEKPFWGLYWFNQFSTLAGPPSFLHRSGTIKKIENFPEELIIGEDAAFHIKLGLFSNIYFIDEFIYNYNRHSESTVSRNNINENRLDIYWKQYVNFYIPYCSNNFNKIPKEFILILNKKLGFSFCRYLLSIKTINGRLVKYKQLISELSSYKLPLFIQIFIRIILFTGSEIVFEIFVKLYTIFYNRPYKYMSISAIWLNEKGLKINKEVINKTKF